MAPLSKVDHSALRTNQAMIIGLSLLGYIFDMPVLAGFVGIVMAVGTLVKRSTANCSARWGWSVQISLRTTLNLTGLLKALGPS